jgi:hypothetical protein
LTHLEHVNFLRLLGLVGSLTDFPTDEWKFRGWWEGFQPLAVNCQLSALVCWSWQQSGNGQAERGLEELFGNLSKTGQT